MPTLYPDMGLEFSENLLGQRTYTLAWHCETDNRSVGPLAVRFALFTQFGVKIGVPYKYHFVGHPSYEIDEGAFCSNIRASMKADAFGEAWHVTASYEPLDPDLINPDVPTDIPILIKYGSTSEERIVDIDLDNRPVVNSAGEPYLNPVTRNVKLETIHVRRYETFYNPALAGLYRNSTNNANWTVEGRTYPARTVRCEEITAEEQWHNLIGLFYVVDYDFIVDPLGWRVSVLDQGLRMKDGSDIVPIYRDGVPVTVPVLLNGSGVPLAEPLPVGTNPVYRTFKFYPERDYTLFNFPV